MFFRSTKPPLSPLFHPHSFGERFFARCQLGVLDAVRCCHLISVLAFLFTREVGPGTCRSHLNSAVELGCSVQTLSVPDSSTPLRSSPSGYYATVRTPLHSPTADAAVPPTCVLPPPPLVSCRFSLLVRQLSVPSAVNSRLTQGECVPVSIARRHRGIFPKVCFIPSGVVGNFCSRVISPAAFKTQ